MTPSGRPAASQPHARDPGHRRAGVRAGADDDHPGVDGDAGGVRRRLPAEIIWMVSAYFLAASIATPVLGRLGDMFGKERFLAVSLGAFAAGSVVCALSNALAADDRRPRPAGHRRRRVPALLRDRARRVPGRRSPPASRCSATAGIGGAIGLPLGGLLVDQASYHWIFWISAAMGGRHDHDHPLRPRIAATLARPGRHVGAVILAAGLSAVLIASRARTTGAGPRTRRSASSPSACSS